MKTLNFLKVGGILFTIAFVLFLFWYGLCVHMVENYQFGYTFDRFSGEIKPVPHSGWVITKPWVVNVHTIDLRPHQVCMNANNRVLNCKLVQFNTNGFAKFIEVHGRGAGSSSSSRRDADIYEILKSYAFNVNGGADCPFLTILDEMERKPTTTVARTSTTNTVAVPRRPQ